MSKAKYLELLEAHTILHVDFESQSIIDLKNQGMDRYHRHPSTKPILLAWAFDDDEPVIWEPHLGPPPKEVILAAKSDVTFGAWHAGFERGGFLNWLGLWIDYDRWEDPSTWARHLSLPGSLQSVSDILMLGDEGKDKEGKRLIQLFSLPHYEKIRPLATNENTLFDISPLVPPEPKFVFMDAVTHPEDWELFKEYCKQDVRTERRLMKELQPFKLPELERKIWCLDQRINEVGLPVNRGFVKKALVLAERSKEELKAQLKEKTGLENPNSRDQMLEWLGAQRYHYNSLEKGSVQSALSKTDITPLAREVLLLRKEAAKTSYKKFEAILDRLGDDDRLRHQYLYLGAARSGRWSGSGVQVQNLTKPTKEVSKNLELTLAQIESLDYEALKAAHPSVLTAVGSCVRSVFQAPAGKKIIVCDLNAIENRVLGWMAGCDAILKVFRDGYDPYLAFAARMYNCKYEDLADMTVIPHKPKNADAAAKRQIAKSGILGCGYGLGPGVEKICTLCGHRWGYKNRCSNRKCYSKEFTFEIIWITNHYGDQVMTGLIKYAADMGVVMTPKQAYFTWYAFRQAYPEVVQLWKDLQAGAMQVLKIGGKAQVGVVTFDVLDLKNQAVLRMTLPSGRALHYLNAQVKIRYLTGRDGEDYEREAIEYYGIGHGVGVATTEEGGQGTNWGPVFLHPGKICENGDQAISRDVFANGLLLADEMGCELIGHSHDEALVLADDNDLDFGLEDLRICMSTTPNWANGLPLAAEGFESRIYRKG